MKKVMIALLGLAIIVVGCSKRENPAEPALRQGTLWTGFVDSQILEESILQQSSGKYISIYTPPGYSAITATRMDSVQVGPDSFEVHEVLYVVNHDYPVVYLLHGFGGDYNYYANLFALKRMLDEMISEGSLGPMVVVVPSGSNPLGGSFYVNSPRDSVSDTSFAGRFEDYFIEEVIPYIEQNYAVDTSANGRGISGHSMGGYAAYYLAMRHPQLFGSVSAMSAPLCFDTLLTLLPAVFAENGFEPGDTTAFYSIFPQTDRPLTTMMFAMGAAFSPHCLSNPDTTLFHRLMRTSRFYGVDLPFTASGEIDSALWHVKWLAHDPFTMLVSGGGATALAGKALYLDCGQADDYRLQQHAKAFHAALTDAGLEHTYVEYQGYAGTPADHLTFVADRLRQALLFHNAHFEGE